MTKVRSFTQDIGSLFDAEVVTGRIALALQSHYLEANTMRTRTVILVTMEEMRDE